MSGIILYQCSFRNWETAWGRFVPSSFTSVSSTYRAYVGTKRVSLMSKMSHLVVNSRVWYMYCKECKLIVILLRGLRPPLIEGSISLANSSNRLVHSSTFRRHRKRSESSWVKVEQRRVRWNGDQLRWSEIRWGELLRWGPVSGGQVGWEVKSSNVMRGSAGGPPPACFNYLDGVNVIYSKLVGRRFFTHAA